MQTLTEKQCNRCGHKWFPRSTDEPTICPKCKSPYWNRQRKEKKNSKMEEKIMNTQPEKMEMKRP
jgi:uncharacterized Zn finger protein (UPF0148 family)